MNRNHPALPFKEFRKAKLALLSQARKKHGRIIPCGNLNSSFTKEANMLYFWYLTPQDMSSHLTSCKLVYKKRTFNKHTHSEKDR